MKNKVLFAVLICLASISSAWAQIPNYSFETWASDTNYLNLTLSTPATLDTAVSSNPTNWTTSNEVTNGRVFHYKSLVTQSNNFYVGASAIKLTSDSVSAEIDNTAVGTVHIGFVCPGFTVCGKFPINLSSFVSLGATFNPALLPGAGIPVSGTPAKIGGYMKYSPVGGDSTYIVAILRKGGTVVAQATYTRSTTDAAYSYFEAPFVYQNCLQPDTLVYTISSGNPYSISGVAFGTPSGLHVGSSVLVDSIFYSGTELYGVSYPQNDSAVTTVNTPVLIAVTNNDSSCDQRIFTLAQSIAPKHGTISIVGDSILYTPNQGYAGADTFKYSEAVGTGPLSTATVIVKMIGWATGINNVTEGKTSIYPNPASSKLHITSSNPSVTEFHIYDMLGNVMKAEAISSDTTVDLSGFNNGLYIIQFSSSEGKMISSARFTVIK